MKERSDTDYDNYLSNNPELKDMLEQLPPEVQDSEKERWKEGVYNS